MGAGCLRILTIAFLLFAAESKAEYYLKFETSGAVLPNGTPLNSSGDAWITVSVVDLQTFPLDGPVHFPGDRSGAEVYYRNESGSYIKNVEVNYTKFYVAEVPRSLTVRNRSNGLRHVLTAGGGAQTYTNAPAILLEDGLLVTTGIAFAVALDDLSYSQSIFITAAPPRTIGAVNTDENFTVASFPPAFSSLAHVFTRLQDRSYASCTTGWYNAGVEGNTIAMSQSNARPPPTGGCANHLIYLGRLSHVVRFE